MISLKKRGILIIGVLIVILLFFIALQSGFLKPTGNAVDSIKDFFNTILSGGGSSFAYNGKTILNLIKDYDANTNNWYVICYGTACDTISNYKFFKKSFDLGKVQRNINLDNYPPEKFPYKAIIVTNSSNQGFFSEFFNGENKDVFGLRTLSHLGRDVLFVYGDEEESLVNALVVLESYNQQKASNIIFYPGIFDVVNFKPGDDFAVVNLLHTTFLELPYISFNDELLELQEESNTLSNLREKYPLQEYSASGDKIYPKKEPEIPSAFYEGSSIFSDKISIKGSNLDKETLVVTVANATKEYIVYASSMKDAMLYYGLEQIPYQDVAAVVNEPDEILLLENGAFPVLGENYDVKVYYNPYLTPEKTSGLEGKAISEDKEGESINAIGEGLFGIIGVKSKDVSYCSELDIFSTGNFESIEIDGYNLYRTPKGVAEKYTYYGVIASSNPKGNLCYKAGESTDKTTCKWFYESCLPDKQISEIDVKVMTYNEMVSLLYSGLAGRVFGTIPNVDTSNWKNYITHHIFMNYETETRYSYKDFEWGNCQGSGGNEYWSNCTQRILSNVYTMKDNSKTIKITRIVPVDKCPIKIPYCKVKIDLSKYLNQHNLIKTKEHTTSNLNFDYEKTFCGCTDPLGCCGGKGDQVSGIRPTGAVLDNEKTEVYKPISYLIDLTAELDLPIIKEVGFRYVPLFKKVSSSYTSMGFERREYPDSCGLPSTVYGPSKEEFYKSVKGTIVDSWDWKGLDVTDIYILGIDIIPTLTPEFVFQKAIQLTAAHYGVPKYIHKPLSEIASGIVIGTIRDWVVPDIHFFPETCDCIKDETGNTCIDNNLELINPKTGEIFLSEKCDSEYIQRYVYNYKKCSQPSIVI